ncbi:MAG TPA: DUF1345 domain-containing protein [Chitinophagaceae bacterium]|jgi:uncharacterized membrane protein|nr:DUF1345 domain-containing protein [Chitinophagaceae bacterium]
MTKTSVRKKPGNFLLRMMPVHRFLISLILAIIVYFFIISVHVEVMVRLMICWSVFALSYIITSCVVFFRQKPAQIRELSKREDGSRLYVFSLVILTSFVSMLTVLLLMRSQNVKATPEIIFIPVAIGSMLFSWIMVHTIFAFHYAHLYYGDDTNDSTKHAEGLEFPGKEKPDYFDFAYFSFVIGMTFQVSDVDVTSRSIRRLVLLHGLLSFGLNTFVVALTINLIAGLLK